jgi:hypothetical protein
MACASVGFSYARGLLRISRIEHETLSAQGSFNPKPEAMVAATCGRSIPLPAIASGFGLNDVNDNVTSR